MNELEFAKKFVEMVDAGVSLRAYKKVFGWNRALYEKHIAKLHIYRAMISEVKKSEKPKEKKYIVQKEVKKALPSSLISKVYKKRKNKKDDKKSKDKED